MIEKVIGTILEAEERAEEIINNAREEAKNIILEAENTVVGMRKAVRHDIKLRLREIHQRADADGDKYHAEAVAQEKINLTKKYEKVNKDKLSDIAVEKYLSKYGVT